MLNKIVYTILGVGMALMFFPHPGQDTAIKPTVSGISIQAESSGLKLLKSAPEIALNVDPPILTAHAAIAYDLDSGAILYSNNLDQKLPIASLTKLMTALIVVTRENLNSTVTIMKADETPIGSTVGLVAGEKILVSDLLAAMLIPSGNDAALALANYVSGSPEKFAYLMNQEAEKLNLANTQFSNPVGWDVYDSQENFSNTLDLIKIVQEFLKYDELRQIVKTQEMNITSTDGKYTHQLRTTNKLLLDDPEVEGIKTGFTSKALGNLVILTNHNGNQILTVVLGSDNREEDTQKLLDWLFVVYRW